MADAGGQPVREHINDDISEMLSAAAFEFGALQRLLRRTRRPSHSGREIRFAGGFAIFSPLQSCAANSAPCWPRSASWPSGPVVSRYISTGAGTGVR